MKLREPFVYFVDRSLGGTLVVAALRKAGEQAHAHDDHFAQDTPDDVWLPVVAKRGWVVLTKDKNIRRNELERIAIVQSHASVFMLGRGDLTAETMARIFIEALPSMRRALRRFGPALVVSVTALGHARVLMAEGKLLQPPRELK